MLSEAPNRLPAGRHQITNKFHHRNSKQFFFGHLKLDFGAYLGFGICHLEFLPSSS